MLETSREVSEIIPFYIYALISHTSIPGPLDLDFFGVQLRSCVCRFSSNYEEDKSLSLLFMLKHCGYYTKQMQFIMQGDKMGINHRKIWKNLSNSCWNFIDCCSEKIYLITSCVLKPNILNDWHFQSSTESLRAYKYLELHACLQQFKD